MPLDCVLVSELALLQRSLSVIHQDIEAIVTAEESHQPLSPLLLSVLQSLNADHVPANWRALHSFSNRIPGDSVWTRLARLACAIMFFNRWCQGGLPQRMDLQSFHRPDLLLRAFLLESERVAGTAGSWLCLSNADASGAGAATSISKGILLADGLVLRNGYLQPLTGQVLAVPFKAGKFEWNYKDTAFELSSRSIEAHKVRHATVLPTVAIHLQQGDTRHHHFRCPVYPRWREICEATQRHDIATESHVFLKCADVPSVIQAGVSLHCEYPSYRIPPASRVNSALRNDPQEGQGHTPLLGTELLRQVLSVPIAQKAPRKTYLRPT
jgi:hypothetical protein